MNRAASLLRQNVVSQVPRRNKAYLGQLKGSMNDLPTPAGSWKTNYDAANRKYNAHLALGIGFFAATLLVGQSLGCFYLNATVPSEPVAKNEYKG